MIPQRSGTIAPDMPHHPSEHTPAGEGPLAVIAENRLGEAGGILLSSKSLILWGICLALATGLLLFRLTGVADGSGRRPEAPPVENGTVMRSVVKRPTLQTANATAMPYEEALGGPLEESIKRVDYALIQNLLQLGYESDRMQLDHVETRTVSGSDYHFQQIDFVLDESPAAFVENLKPLIDFWADEASLDQVNATTWRIAVLGRPTHQLDFLRRQDLVPGPKPTPSVNGPKIVIVIDDLGENVAFARDLANLGFPVTFAIWPRASHTREVAKIAQDAGLEIILHQPMEPISYPKTKPGPGAVYVRMTPDEVSATVAKNLELVPGAVGLNNHMGSRFTQDAEGVAAVLRVLKARRFMVLDSLTHPKSVFGRVANSMGVSGGTRDVFLDVVRSERSVLHQLIKAERIAEKKGSAIAIGHPFPETLAGLRQWVRTRDASITPVNLATLIAPGAATHARVEKSPKTR
ncbi:divergent polysaccharide deacetylase family protein [Oceanidesulfovibrio marinus]|uniref:Divergent polysaccharide deacetylase family protein n=1 Tax=Oceanidesulfovibrio marinus TaxID=370038 RepID=A0A6P1ZET2_9BACT|nr:divergent polysaccharide deacetylase family protein [Oceanidesulfovibrio marinus]TVM33003.1 divergent polysaccharide deacetylase family protein [Oceanidesulfovibrio marinus]